MANRDFSSKQYTLQKGIVDLFFTVSVGAAGAPTLQRWVYPSFGSSAATTKTYTPAATTGGGTGNFTRYAQGAEGVFSVVRTGAGTWTVTLQDTYQRMLQLDGYTARAGGLVTVADFAEDTTVTNMNATGGSVIGVVMFNSSDSPGDGSSGDNIRLHMALQSDSMP